MSDKNEDDAYITWTHDKYERLKAAYAKARLRGHDKFMLDDIEFVTTYAKYLIMYLDTVFKGPKK